LLHRGELRLAERVEFGYALSIERRIRVAGEGELVARKAPDLQHSITALEPETEASRCALKGGVALCSART
jgi:hypothetical protein